MQTTPLFPVVPNHQVACFNCGEDLSAQPPIDTGYPDRHGRFRKRCPRCAMLTFYDVHPATAE